MNYGETLAKTWNTVWKNKVLLVFGFLPHVLSYFIILSGLLNTGRNSSDPNSYLAALIPVYCVTFFIGILSYAATAIGQIGLYRGTFAVERGDGELRFGELLSKSWQFFWRVVGVNFLISFVFGLVVGGSACLMQFVVILIPNNFGLFCFIPFLIIAIPLSFLIQVLTVLSAISVVGKGDGVTDAITRAQNMMKKNLGTLAVMSLILVVGGGLLNFVVMLPYMAVSYLPLINQVIASPTLVSIQSSGISTWFPMVYYPLVIVFQSIVYTLTSVAWTMTFIRLDPPASVESVEPQENSIASVDDTI